MANEKNIDINIQTAIATSRGIGSLVGSLTGQQYNKVETKNMWPGGDQGWDQDAQKVRDGLTNMFMLNRKPMKYVMKDVNIFGATYVNLPMGAGVGIAINLDPATGKSDYVFPLDKDVYKLVKSTPEAIEDALNGEGENFFLNPVSVADFLNKANQQNINALKALSKTINDMIQTLVTTSKENTAKAQRFAKELAESKVETVNFKELLRNNEVSAMVEVKATSETE